MYPHMRHDSFALPLSRAQLLYPKCVWVLCVYVPWLLFKCDVALSRVCHGSFICESWPICAAVTHSCGALTQVCVCGVCECVLFVYDELHLCVYMWHDLTLMSHLQMTHVIWMGRWYVSHDSFALLWSSALQSDPMASVCVSHMCVHVTWPHTHVTHINDSHCHVSQSCICVYMWHDLTLMSHISMIVIAMWVNHVWVMTHSCCLCTALLPFHRCVCSMCVLCVCICDETPSLYGCLYKHTRIHAYCHTHVQRAYKIRLQT